jgi:hypothetical protein
MPDTNPPNHDDKIVFDVPDAFLQELKSKLFPPGDLPEDPYQGFDISLNMPQPVVSFSIDYMTQNLWFRRGLLPSDLEHLGTGKLPVPEVIFMSISSPEEGGKTLIIHTSGIANIVELNGGAGREVVALELVVDYNQIEVVDQVATIKED